MLGGVAGELGDLHGGGPGSHRDLDAGALLGGLVYTPGRVLVDDPALVLRAALLGSSLYLEARLIEDAGGFLLRLAPDVGQVGELPSADLQGDLRPRVGLPAGAWALAHDFADGLLAVHTRALDDRKLPGCAGDYLAGCVYRAGVFEVRDLRLRRAAPDDGGGEAADQGQQQEQEEDWDPTPMPPPPAPALGVR